VNQRQKGRKRYIWRARKLIVEGVNDDKEKGKYDGEWKSDLRHGKGKIKEGSLQNK